MGSHKLHKLTSLFVKKTIAPGKLGSSLVWTTKVRGVVFN